VQVFLRAVEQRSKTHTVAVEGHEWLRSFVQLGWFGAYRHNLARR
jgi:hypothetical protein